jgi:hypothetical protein
LQITNIVVRNKDVDKLVQFAGGVEQTVIKTGMGCIEGRLCSRNGMGTPRTMAQDLTPGTDWWNRLLLPQTYALVKKPDWSVDVSLCVSFS